MTERERFESWARQRWTHPEDFDQRIKAPSKYNNYEVQAAWDAWQERAAQNAPSVPTPPLVAIADLVAQTEICARVGFVDTPDDKDSCAAFCVSEGTWIELMSCVEALASALAAAPKPEAKP